MKRIQKVGMDGILIDEEKSIKKAPRKYIPGIIEEYIKERNDYWRINGSESLKQALKEYENIGSM